MRNNIVTAHVGEKAYVETEPVFQYDYGLTLVIDGVTLPSEYKVHFGNTNSAANKTATGGAEGVAIPDEYLLNGEDIHAYLYMSTNENNGFSVYHIRIPVTDRAAIAEEEITPIQHNVIEEALEALQEAVAETHANVLNYPYINDEEYWMVYDAEREEFVNTGIKANGDNAFDLSIGTVTTLAPGAHATASVEWDGDHAYLNLGIPAGDATSAVSIHDTRSNAASITIYDGADNIALDNLEITVEPIQEGSGQAGPRNIRRIYPVDSVTFNSTGGNYLTSFGENPGLIYGAKFYPMTGRIVVDHVLIAKNCTTMDVSDVQPGWRNSGVREFVGDNVSQIFDNEILNIGTSYGVDTTGDNDILYLPYDRYGMRQSEWINTEITVQICVRLANPVEYTLASFIPTTQLGENVYSVDHGKIAYMKYPCDTKIYIDRKISGVQALVIDA